MSAVTKTTPTFTQLQAGVVKATGTQGTLATLDLTLKMGAWITAMIGRRVATALTRFGYVSIRPTLNDTLLIPSPLYDAISSTAAAIATTLNGATSIGDGTITLTSATSFAVGDTICISDSSATRVPEFNRVLSISGSVLTLERNLRVAHNSGDDVVTMADVQRIWLPGGDIYEIRTQNNSGQSLVFRVESQVDTGETIT